MKQVCTGLALLATAFLLISFTSADIAFAQEDIILVRGEAVPITAQLLQNGTFGDPVGNQRLYFYDQFQDTLIESAMTDVNGFASVLWNISIDYPLGPSLLNVTFEGNDTLSLAPSYQWVSVNVVSKTILDVQIDEQTVHPEDDVSLAVEIIDDHGSPITGASMSIYSDDIHLASSTTNGSGHAEFSINCNISWCTIGANNLRVVYDSDLVRFYNGSETSFQILVQQISTSLEIQSSSGTEMQLNDSFWLQMIIQAGGIAQSGASLDVMLDESPIDTVVSDEYGLADLDINIQYTLGPHTLRVEYSGTFRYASSYLEINIIVSSPAIMYLEFPNQILAGEDTHVQVTLHDIFQRPISGTSVEIYDYFTEVTYDIIFPTGQSSTTTRITFDAPLGLRQLQIITSTNPYLTNTTKLISITIWSQPDISIVQCSTYGYASPSQEVTFEIQLNASENPVSGRFIEWRIDGSTAASSVTDSLGVAKVSFTVPAIEGSYILAMSYNGSETLYELPASLEYEIVVSWVMPIRVNLISYSVSTALQEIAVRLSIIALNGTTLDGVTLHYEWLSHQDRATSIEAGIIELGLRVPENSGVFNLYYEIEETSHLQASIGYHIIIISQSESMASRGVGIPILVLSIVASIIMATIPILWRRRLVE